MKSPILIVAIGLIAVPAGSAWAGAKPGAGVVEWADSRRAALERQVAEGQAELERLQEINRRLDKVIAAANIGDVVLSNALKYSGVPLAGEAYSSGKVVGYLVMGKTEEAIQTGFIAVTSKFEPFKALDEFYDVIVVVENTNTLLSN